MLAASGRPVAGGSEAWGICATERHRFTTFSSRRYVSLPLLLLER